MTPYMKRYAKYKIKYIIRMLTCFKLNDDCYINHNEFEFEYESHIALDVCRDSMKSHVYINLYTTYCIYAHRTTLGDEYIKAKSIKLFIHPTLARAYVCIGLCVSSWQSRCTYAMHWDIEKAPSDKLSFVARFDIFEQFTTLFESALADRLLCFGHCYQWLDGLVYTREAYWLHDPMHCTEFYWHGAKSRIAFRSPILPIFISSLIL